LMKESLPGYIVLTFVHTPKALPECPVFGNAILHHQLRLEAFVENDQARVADPLSTRRRPECS
jgi:hypothetical protein